VKFRGGITQSWNFLNPSSPTIA